MDVNEIMYWRIVIKISKQSKKEVRSPKYGKYRMSKITKNHGERWLRISKQSIKKLNR